MRDALALQVVCQVCCACCCCLSQCCYRCAYLGMLIHLCCHVILWTCYLWAQDQLPVDIVAGIGCLECLLMGC